MEMYACMYVRVCAYVCFSVFYIYHVLLFVLPLN